MKIQCLLERPNGTEVTIETTDYHFKPTDADKRHLAEVTEPKHIRRFLSISEAYAVPDGETMPDLPPVSQEEKQEINRAGYLGTTKYPLDFFVTIGQSEVPIKEIIARVAEDLEFSVDEWNELSDEERNAYILDQIDIEKGTLLAEGGSIVMDKPIEMLQGSNWEPQEVTVEGVVYKTVDLVIKAFELSGLTESVWNTLPKEVVEEHIQAALKNTDAPEKELTRGQKAALTRAANKAKTE